MRILYVHKFLLEATLIVILGGYRTRNNLSNDSSFIYLGLAVSPLVLRVSQGHKELPWLRM